MGVSFNESLRNLATLLPPGKPPNVPGDIFIVVLITAAVLLIRTKALCPTTVTFTSGPRYIELKVNTAASVPLSVF
jgi:hypothetical protein